MNSIAPSNLNRNNAVKFTGSAQIVKKEMYAVTDSFSQVVERLTQDRFLSKCAKFQGTCKPKSPLKQEPFIQTLSKLLRRSVEDVKVIFDVKDEAKLNKEFFQLRENFNKTQKAYAKAKKIPIEGNELVEHLHRIFKTDLSAFLKKNNFVNDEYVFDKLPAKFAVLKKGDTHIDDNLAKLADKVIINKGVVLNSPTGNKLVIRGLKDKEVQIVADKIDIKNSTFGSILSTEGIKGFKKVKGSSMESINGGIDLFGGGNSVPQLKAKKAITVDIPNAESIESTDSHVRLYAESNTVGTIKAKDYIIAKNLTAKSIESTDSYAHLGGEKNVVGSIKTKQHTTAKNLTADSVESLETQVELLGDKNSVGKLKSVKGATATNLSADSVEVTAGSLGLNGEKNEVREFIKAKDNICAHSIDTPIIESVEGGVQVYGKDNKVGSIKAKSYVVGENLQVNHIETDTGVVKGTINGCKFS